jgi:DNA end-binding protein Ku
MVALGGGGSPREHMIALEQRSKGLLGIILRYPYEIWDEHAYFDKLTDEKIPKDMLEAQHIRQSPIRGVERR